MTNNESEVLENNQQSVELNSKQQLFYNTDFGFIITRHVNSAKTNRYWNRNVKLLKTYYPYKLIVIIDDNSNPEFLSSHHDYKNLIIIQSEYPGRGELLPYIYYAQNKWFERAVIIHDGVFFHNRICFEKFNNFPAISMWHFHPRFNGCHIDNSLRIANSLNFSDIIKNYLHKKNWVGCFGLQSYIKHSFLTMIMNKYNMNNLINVVTCRDDRCSLERIFAVIFFLELRYTNSILGDMTKLDMWNRSFDEYVKKPPMSKVIKVFTGR
uniref:Glycosyltransferase n=1 Tax=viral metagenome TaxID=1070528 RepID=A0A6C0D935_9ZZZZ